jgi:thioredoxin-like negative regulator of GroEL
VVEIRILNEIGRIVTEPLVEFSETPAGDSQFRRCVVAPVDLPPGEYSMIITLADEMAGEVLRRAIRVVVVGDGEERGWVGARDSDLSADAGGVVAVSDKVQKVNKKDIRAAYRAALRRLGDGDTLSARRMVADLERQGAANRPWTAMLAVGEAEYAEGKALAKANPSCLMLLALLHRDLYRGYSARREGILATHARKIAITYAEDLGRLKPYNGFSEGLMVNLARDLAQAGSSGAAQTLLERVRDLSPGFRPAILSLGFSFERASDYLEAALVYERLVETNPSFDEGRLRLGINLIRTGREEAGQKLLSDLRQGGSKAWIEAIAGQEMVRLLIQQGQMSEAEREVRAALEQMPDDQRLWILLASIFERSDRHDRAIEVLTNLPPASRGVSPRARYGEWPALGVRASQVHLAARAAEAVPSLQAALAAQGGAR